MATQIKKAPAKKSNATKKKAPAKKAKVDDILIAVVLDRSGSMGVVRDATIEGFNGFVDGQRDQKDGGKARLTLVQFASGHDVNFVAEPIENIPALDQTSYVPSGGTALNDAIARTIHDTEAWLAENESNDRVMVCIITDGEENSSHEYRGAAGLERLTALIGKKESDDQWTFMFMGANIDAFAAASTYSIPQTNTVEYDSTPESSSASFAAMSTATQTHRTSGVRGQSEMMANLGDTQHVRTAYDAGAPKRGKLSPTKKA